MNRILHYQISPNFYAFVEEQILVLQNLSYFGYRTKDYRKQLNLQEFFKFTLKILTKFHAASYKLYLQNNELFNEKFKEVLYFQQIVNDIVKLWLPVISTILWRLNFLLKQIQR